jgi:hypothetical protein
LEIEVQDFNLQSQTCKRQFPSPPFAQFVILDRVAGLLPRVMRRHTILALDTAELPSLRSLVMKKWIVLLGTFLLSCMCVGCSQDPNDELVARTIAQLNATTGFFEQVAKTVNEAGQDYKNNNKAQALVKIQKAITEAGQFKTPAAELQQIKARTEIRKDNISTAEKETLDSKYKAPFMSALAELDTAQKKLTDALKKTERAADEANDMDGKNSLELLRQKLKEAQDEFEVFTKRQT